MPMIDGVELLAVKTAEFAGRARWTRSFNGDMLTLPLHALTLDESTISNCYEHRMVCGEGDTAEEAINDWFGKLPTDKVEAIIWRVTPEIASEVDFSTNKRMCRVFSRFAIVPSNVEKKDAT